MNDCPMCQDSKEVSITPLFIEDCRVDVCSMGTAVEKAWSLLANPTPGFVMAVNPEKIRAMRYDESLRELNHSATLCLPDGIGIVLCAKILGYKSISRVTGIDFCYALVSRAAVENVKIFVYGGRPGVAEKAVERLKEQLPGLQVAGICDGYISEHQMPDLVQKIQTSGAKILLVALGSPKQEQWISRYKDQLGDVRIIQTIGGTLDVFSGELRRAPAVFQKLGLEWFYRLMKQPSRLPRYMKLIFFFPVLYKALSRRYL